MLKFLARRAFLQKKIELEESEVEDEDQVEPSRRDSVSTGSLATAITTIELIHNLPLSILSCSNGKWYLVCEIAFPVSDPRPPHRLNG